MGEPVGYELVISERGAEEFSSIPQYERIGIASMLENVARSNDTIENVDYIAIPNEKISSQPSAYDRFYVFRHGRYKLFVSIEEKAKKVVVFGIEPLSNDEFQLISHATEEKFQKISA